MSIGLLRRLGLWLAPDIALAATFALAWFAPRTPGAAALTECRVIMLMEGVSILAAALVGVYVEVSFVCFPLILASCVIWLVKAGSASYAWPLFCFAWFLTSAFIDGILAHRGRFGQARENPAHPERRLDRKFFLYLMTAPVLPALFVAANPQRWAIWGTVYFVALAAVDSFLRGPFDRIPQGLLRRLRKGHRSDLGVCFDCVYLQPAIPPQPGRAIRCGLSATDKRFEEHPPTPVLACEGHRRIPGEKEG